MRVLNILLFVSIVALLFSSCEKEDPEIPNEEEVITTLEYQLTPDGGGEDVIFTFLDLDGDGGDAPVITGGTLNANTTYQGVLILLNEQDTPSLDISEEVEEEGVDHQFFFTTTIDGLEISYADQDDNAQPIGLVTSLSTGDPGSGTLQIILRHEPDKSATGVSSGEITLAGGETDIEVTFDVEVE